MRRLYEPAPDPAEAALFGFTADELVGPPLEVWPENWAAVELFSRLGTQWRVGVNGPTGLDYTAVLAMMARMRLSDEDHDDLFDAMQVMEREALDVMQHRD